MLHSTPYSLVRMLPIRQKEKNIGNNSLDEFYRQPPWQKSKTNVQCIMYPWRSRTKTLDAMNHEGSLTSVV